MSNLAPCRLLALNPIIFTLTSSFQLQACSPTLEYASANTSNSSPSNSNPSRDHPPQARTTSRPKSEFPPSWPHPPAPAPDPPRHQTNSPLNPAASGIATHVSATDLATNLASIPRIPSAIFLPPSRPESPSPSIALPTPSPPHPPAAAPQTSAPRARPARAPQSRASSKHS